jgi:hypothetical protein
MLRSNVPICEAQDRRGAPATPEGGFVYRGGGKGRGRDSKSTILRNQVPTDKDTDAARNVELFPLNPNPNCLPSAIPKRPSKATIGGAGLFTRWSLEKTASEVKGSARQTIAFCTAWCGQVLTGFGAKAKRFRGGGSSRAWIRGGARCLFSGTGLAAFRLKQEDRCPVRILRVYDTHHGLAGTGIRVA